MLRGVVRVTRPRPHRFRAGRCVLVANGMTIAIAEQPVWLVRIHRTKSVQVYIQTEDRCRGVCEPVAAGRATAA